MKKVLWTMLVLIIALSAVILFFPSKKDAVEVKQPAVIYPANPKDATYIIDDVGVTFVGGSSTMEAAPGSAMTIDTKIFGEPVMGDLDGDGDSDAALLLQQDPGGTGTFYYLAAAVNTGNGYRGTNALFLGDRIAPQNIDIFNTILVANYADRKPNEPFSVKPTVGTSRYAQLLGEKIQPIEVSGDGVYVAYGFATYGDEVRTFSPCGAGNSADWWVIGDSPAYNAIFDPAKAAAAATGKPTLPMFAVLVGKTVPAPTDGFGADYKQAFYAMKLVKFVAGGSCQARLPSESPK